MALILFGRPVGNSGLRQHTGIGLRERNMNKLGRRSFNPAQWDSAPVVALVVMRPIVIYKERLKQEVMAI